MPKPPIDKAGNNHHQLGDFRQYWMNSPDYPARNLGNNFIEYDVDVHYVWDGGKREKFFQTLFRAILNPGRSEGDVHLDETVDVKVDDFHLAFKPKFQIYTYDQINHTLIVTGSSPKMGGEYKVKIKPTLVEY